MEAVAATCSFRFAALCMAIPDSLSYIFAVSRRYWQAKPDLCLPTLLFLLGIRYSLYSLSSYFCCMGGGTIAYRQPSNEADMYLTPQQDVCKHYSTGCSKAFADQRYCRAAVQRIGRSESEANKRPCCADGRFCYGRKNKACDSSHGQAWRHRRLDTSETMQTDVLCC